MEIKIALYCNILKVFLKSAQEHKNRLGKKAAEKYNNFEIGSNWSAFTVGKLERAKTVFDMIFGTLTIVECYFPSNWIEVV